MARYINTKTKAVIETACVICGEYWKMLEDKTETAKKKSAKKKSE